MKKILAQVQRLFQKMALTPKMKHSIQLLSMSLIDLNEYIETVLASNPFLQKQIEATLKRKDRLAANRTASLEYDDGIQNTEKAVDARQALMSQLRMRDLDKYDLEIAEYLIYEMDDNGYIIIDLEEAARDLFTDVEDVQKVLQIIQTLDPPGIGARDIRECLQLQLERMNRKDFLEYTIVTEFLSDLAINDIPKIAKSLGVSKDEIIKAVNNVKALNPRPGSTLLGKSAEKVIPDLIVDIKGKKVRLELNRESIPHLRLYNPYENKMEIIQDPNARKFLKENMEAAGHLIDNIKRREETMCRVAEYILKAQREHISEDVTHIKSLTIKEIAEALNFHPSTVSRTVSNKYIQLNGKVLPLKSLLSHGIKKENGELTSKSFIKSRIKKLIEGEDKAKPLRDNNIKELLEQEGISIKRRTVAKYRESLNILPTHLRKRKSTL